ncbi:MAG: hypothetical protein M3211_07355 [Actinomycetota bacterium]|nr:hypothetical protein [Actinomycetota bacterium]
MVGVHFVPLASVFEVPFFRWLGAAIAVCGVAGLVLAATGARPAPVATASGLLPGAMLLASGWWGATHDLRRVPARQPQ